MSYLVIKLFKMINPTYDIGEVFIDNLAKNSAKYNNENNIKAKFKSLIEILEEKQKYYVGGNYTQQQINGININVNARLDDLEQGLVSYLKKNPIDLLTISSLSDCMIYKCNQRP